MNYFRIVISTEARSVSLRSPGANRTTDGTEPTDTLTKFPALGDSA